MYTIYQHSRSIQTAHCILLTMLLHAGSLLFATESIETQKQSEEILIIDPTNQLWEVDESAFAAAIPKRHGISYMLSHWSTDIQSDFEEFLTQFGVQREPAHLVTRSPQGTILAQIVVDWLRGIITHDQFVHKIRGKSRDKIFVDIAQIAFNPNKLAQNTHVIRGATAFIASCAQQVGSHRIYLVGNWDPGSFTALSATDTSRALLRYIPMENRFISGFTHQILPSNLTTIMEQITSQAHCSLAHCIFITAMPYHARAARTLGMRTVLVDRNDFGSALQQVSAFIRGRDTARTGASLS